MGASVSAFFGATPSFEPMGKVFQYTANDVAYSSLAAVPFVAFVHVLPWTCFLFGLPASLTKYGYSWLPSLVVLAGFLLMMRGEEWGLAWLYEPPALVVRPGPNIFSNAWRVLQDPASILRLSRWYNIEGITNKAGIVMVFSATVIGYSLRRLSQHSKRQISSVVLMLAGGGALFIHLRWMYDLFDKKLWTTLYSDIWEAEFVTSAGKTAVMAPVWFSNYLSLYLVVVVWVLMERPSRWWILLGGPGFGASVAVKSSLEHHIDKRLKGNHDSASIKVGLAYMMAAMLGFLLWMPHQMYWVDAIWSYEGRLQGGMLSTNMTYATMSVILPFPSIVFSAFGFYTSQKTPGPVLVYLLFSTVVFLFFQLAVAMAIVLAFAHLQPMGPPHTDQPLEKKQA